LSFSSPLRAPAARLPEFREHRQQRQGDDQQDRFVEVLADQG